MLQNLYVEAVGLLIKTAHKLKQSEVTDAQLHLQAVQEFLQKNTLYSKILGNTDFKPDKILAAAPENIAAPKPQIYKPQGFSYKNTAPAVKQQPKQITTPSDTADDLW